MTPPLQLVIADDRALIRVTFPGEFHATIEMPLVKFRALVEEWREELREGPGS
jgi:hypothetical protein